MEQIWQNGPQDGYTWFAQLKECYDALVDEQSKEIFQARLLLDIAQQRFSYNVFLKYTKKNTKLNEIIHSNKKIYLYGAGKMGSTWSFLFQDAGVQIIAIFDRNYKEIVKCGEVPVLAPPSHINDLENDTMIVICSINYDLEIYQNLLDLGIPKERLFRMGQIYQESPDQYFDFMDKYKLNTDFVDAGCLDGNTSILFHKKTNGQYNRIIAFEPDILNYECCKKNMEKYNVDRFDLIQAGLGKEQDIVLFCAMHTGNSAVSPEGTEKIQIVTLDDIAKNRTIGFLKMDIEGSELDALQGAENTIQRDRPLCAICVYHKPGDVLIIMHYLKRLVPEYQFALRHYSTNSNETVLYAFI